MLQQTFAFALLQVFIFSKQCKSQDPPPMDIAGITAKLNQPAIDFLTERVNELAENFLKTTTIPDFNIPILSIASAAIKNLDFVDLNLGKVGLTTAPPNEVVLELGETSFKINGSFKVNLFLFQLASNVSVDIDGAYFKLGVALGRNTLTKTLKVAPTYCNASIAGISFDFSGDPSQVLAIETGLDAYQKVPGNDVAKLVGNNICPVVEDLISNVLSNLLGNFTKTIDLPLNTTVDVSLTQDPIASSNSLQLFVNGTCFPTEDPYFIVQLDPWTLPGLQDSTKMIQGAISQNVLNTYSQSVFTQGYLNLSFKVEDILSTINSLIPDNSQYDVADVTESCIDASVTVDPSEPLTFEFLPGSAPRFEINSGLFTLFVAYKTLLRYHPLLAAGPSDVIALDATYRISGIVYATENKIGWNIYCTNIDVSNTCFSNNTVQVIKNYGVSIINMLLNNLIPTGVLGNLNQLTLPIVLGYSPRNLEIILKQGVLEFAGDIALAE